MKKRINADDFGMSPGVNSSIIKMYQNKKLDSASIILGCQYEQEAIKLAQSNPKLKIGLHFNLTTGTKQSPKHSILTGKSSKFKHGFIGLLLLSIFKKKQLIAATYTELEAQINTLKQHKFKIHHINSHRHIHVIPAIFKVVTQVATKHNIKNIRIINERFWYTWMLNPKTLFLSNGGIIKFLLLKFLSLFTPPPVQQEYFFSILYSCNLSRTLIDKIKVPKPYKAVEIMIHPGNPEQDASLTLEEKKHLISKKRTQECL